MPLPSPDGSPEWVWCDAVCAGAQDANLWDVSSAPTIVMTQRGARRAFQDMLCAAGVEVVQFDFLTPEAVAAYCQERGFLQVRTLHWIPDFGICLAHHARAGFSVWTGQVTCTIMSVSASWRCPCRTCCQCLFSETGSCMHR